MPPREVLMPELEKILYSGYIATGQAVDDFEVAFRNYIGNQNMLSLHSGTDALHIALILAGIKPGDEVISTPMTAEPTNTSIAMVGAKVIFCMTVKLGNNSKFWNTTPITLSLLRLV